MQRNKRLRGQPSKNVAQILEAGDALRYGILSPEKPKESVPPPSKPPPSKPPTRPPCVGSPEPEEDKRPTIIRKEEENGTE